MVKKQEQPIIPISPVTRMKDIYNGTFIIIIHIIIIVYGLCRNIEEEIQSIPDYRHFCLARESQLYSVWLVMTELFTILVDEQKYNNFLKYIMKENTP